MRSASTARAVSSASCNAEKRIRRPAKPFLQRSPPCPAVPRRTPPALPGCPARGPAAHRLSGLEAQHFRLPRAGVHTALETCGLADWETFRELAPHLDLFLFMTSSTWTGPPAAHGRVQPADSGQPARAVPHGQKGSDPNAAAPRTERRSRRAGGGFRHAAGGSGTRGRHRGRGTAALTAMGRASTASSDRLHLRKTLSGGASGGTQGLSRGPGHGGIDLAACPERVSLCWNTLKFLQGRKNVGSLQKRFPSLPQYCLKP